MTKYRIIAVLTAAAALVLAARPAPAGELDDALRPRDIASIVELRSLDVPVPRAVAAAPPEAAPRAAAPAQPEPTAAKPGFLGWLRGLFAH